MDVVITNEVNKEAINSTSKIIYTSSKLTKLKWTMKNL